MLIYVFVDYNYMYIFSYARSLHLAKLYVFNHFILIVISPSFKVDSHIICSILHLVKCLNYEDSNILSLPFDRQFPFNIDCRIAVELIVIA